MLHQLSIRGIAGVRCGWGVWDVGAIRGVWDVGAMSSMGNGDGILIRKMCISKWGHVTYSQLQYHIQQCTNCVGTAGPLKTM